MDVTVLFSGKENEVKKINTVLFMRKYPSCLRWWPMGFIKSWLCLLGFAQKDVINGHEVIFVFPGYGKHIRKIPQAVIGGINSGNITDVVDFGGGGALSPLLKAGALVLCIREECREWTYNPLRRNEASDAVARTAEIFGRFWIFGSVLTWPKIVARRKDRILHRHKDGADIVQMEHCYFVQKLSQSVEPEAFSNLFFTHVEMVVDAVPIAHMTKWQTFKGICHCAFQAAFIGHFLDPLKVRFLKEFLK